MWKNEKEKAFNKIIIIIIYRVNYLKWSLRVQNSSLVAQNVFAFIVYLTF